MCRIYYLLLLVSLWHAFDGGKLRVSVKTMRSAEPQALRVSTLIGVDNLEDSGPKPWQVNQNVCPPVLCRTQSLTKGPGVVQAEPVRIGGFPFFEGDIVLDDKMKKTMSRTRSRGGNKQTRRTTGTRARVIRSRRRKRSTVKPYTRLWKYGVVPYAIDQGLGAEKEHLIERAMRHIETYTCIRFRPRESREKDFLFYINQPGCWSYVGKTGGEQVVSLGYGCDSLGTAVHETAHALGFWHEQSRADRDAYVKVIDKNVSPSAKEQFGKRQKSESSSRGFAYDYLSIMHYGKNYFSVNTSPTLEVIGIGREMGIKIGQRRGLSDLDIAQLRDMYHCNKKDKKFKACPDGWLDFDGHCYRFVEDDVQQFAGASSACESLGGYLLAIRNRREDAFIKDHLNTRYQHSNDSRLFSWRTGGKRGDDDKFIWHDPKGKHRKFKYTAWPADQPGTSTSMILQYARADPQGEKSFIWKGGWAGSHAQLPQFAYPYICEKKGYVCDEDWVIHDQKCYNFQRDKKQYDDAEKRCHRMASRLVEINSAEEDSFLKNYLISTYPKSEKWRTAGRKVESKFVWPVPLPLRKMRYQDWAPKYPSKQDTLVLERYDGSPARFVWKSAWAGAKDRPEAHDYPFICEKDARENCFRSKTKDGRDYRGNLDYTVAGKTCQYWSTQYPHKHSFYSGNKAKDAANGIDNHNYCRNPDGKRSRPWCYVPLKKTTWQYCDISICS